MSAQHRKALAWAVLLSALLAACAPTTRRPDLDPALAKREADFQRQFVVRNDLDTLARLLKVDFTLRQAATPLCGQRLLPAFGLLVSCAADESRTWRPAYAEVLGSEDELVIYSVVPGSPAEACGLLPGDRILAIGGEPALRGKGASDWLSGAMAALVESRGASVTVQRDAGQKTLFLAPTVICASPSALKHAKDLNAYADGERIVVYSGLMGFLPTDDELALVIGHELAHNIMGHLEAKKGNMLLGALADVLVTGLTGVSTGGLGASAGSRAYSHEFEFEADYVGLYFTARAGYDIRLAPTMWRRLAVENPESIADASSSHPASSDRFAALEATMAEIQAKQTRGEDLRPEMQEGKALPE